MEGKKILSSRDFRFQIESFCFMAVKKIKSGPILANNGNFLEILLFGGGRGSESGGWKSPKDF